MIQFSFINPDRNKCTHYHDKGRAGLSKHPNPTYHHIIRRHMTNLTKCFHLQNCLDADTNTVFLYTYVWWLLFLGRFNNTSNYSTIKNGKFRSCNIKTYIKEMGWKGVEWIVLTQNGSSDRSLRVQ